MGVVRFRGGNLKYRAMRLDHGTFSWGSEAISRKCRILDGNYNASNNELVRTKTLVKNAIVSIEAGPFITWYQSFYGVRLGKKRKGEKKEEEEKPSAKQLKKRRQRCKNREVEDTLAT